MIKVMMKTDARDEKGEWDAKYETKEHKDGIHAHVYNGTLTIYATKPEENSDLRLGIAGYEPGRWISWEKV